jgi:hypothetical protein
MKAFAKSYKVTKYVLIYPIIADQNLVIVRKLYPVYGDLS